MPAYQFSMITTQYDSESQIAIVSFNTQSCFTLESDKLMQLQIELHGAVEGLITGDSLVLDLSGLEMFGSEFIRILIQVIKPLKESGVVIVLCGDQTGLLKLCGFPKWLTVTVDCDSALALRSGSGILGASAGAKRRTLVSC